MFVYYKSFVHRTKKKDRELGTFSKFKYNYFVNYNMCKNVLKIVQYRFECFKRELDNNFGDNI